MKTRSINFPVGTILPIISPIENLPKNWLVCDGKEFDHNKYTTLSNYLGSNTTPNLIGRVLVGSGNAKEAMEKQDDNHEPDFPDDKKFISKQYGGEYQHKLTIEELPEHSHSINKGDFGLHHRSFDGNNDKDCPFENKPSGEKLEGTDKTGEDKPHYNLQPYYIVNYIIYAGEI